MITQGYPLWAVESDGTAYAVVGWTETHCAGQRTPYLVPLDGHARGTIRAGDAQVFTFTTTTPTELPRTWPILESAAESNLSDLRERLHGLADGMERAYKEGSPAHHIVARIRQELAR